MVDVREKNAGPKAPVELDGTVLTIGGAEGVQVDLAERQQGTRAVVDVTMRPDGAPGEGLHGWYVATVAIPARRYRMVETGETDEEGNPIEERQAIPLDAGAVEVNLWALPTEESEENERDQGGDDE